jgi:hypothetical protein
MQDREAYARQSAVYFALKTTVVWIRPLHVALKLSAEPGTVLF